jgi:hypothetical protein
MTNDEVAELVESGEHDDHLEALLEQEENDRDRVGAKEVIEDRL